MEEEKKDGFNNSIFDEKPKEESVKSGFSNVSEGVTHLCKGIWCILTKRFYMNLILLLLIIVLAGVIFHFSFPINDYVNETNPVKIYFSGDVDNSLFAVDGVGDIISANCNEGGLENTLSDLGCAKCTACETCPECVCVDNSTNVIYYQCLDGRFVEEKSECY